ncbi:MAG: glycosyltransferase family 4 protein [Nitrospira sp.]|jgi:glycosyltransferase involved in cell wall biosynthesis
MKILVFTSLYPNNVCPNHGVFVKERMTAFARLDGCETRVIAPVPYFPPVHLTDRVRYRQVTPIEIIEGVPVYHPRYPMIPKLAMSFHGLGMFIGALPVVRRLKREFDFDAIDAHYVYPDGFAAVLLARYFGVPMVVSARGSDISQFSEFPIVRRFLRYTLNRANHAIAVCDALKVAMMELGCESRKIAVIPNGVDTKKFHPIQKQEAKARLGLSDTRLVVSVGGLIPRKGHDLLLKGFQQLLVARGRRDVMLAIIGEGPLRKTLEREIEILGLRDCVRLVGAVPHHELINWYSAADASCLASSREGWANVILESMACGTPVVATAVWGSPEIISTDRVGLLTACDPDDIAVALGKALERVWDRDEILAHAQQYTWRNAAEHVQAVLQGVIQESKGRTESLVARAQS